MKRSLPFVLALVGVLVGATGVSAACRRFGTQLDCDLGGRQLVIGTQAAPAPRYAGDLAPQMLGGGGRFPGRVPGPDRAVRLELQNVGTDAALCWKLGNETYCH
jgi:hypothetical protein